MFKPVADFPLENLILARKQSFHAAATAPSRGTLAPIPRPHIMKLEIINGEETEVFDVTELDYELEGTEFKGKEFQIRKEGKTDWKYFEFIILFIEEEILIFRVNNNDHPELSNKGIVKAMIEKLREKYNQVIISSTNIPEKKIHEDEGRISTVTKYWEKWKSENPKIILDKGSGRYKYEL